MARLGSETAQAGGSSAEDRHAARAGRLRDFGGSACAGGEVCAAAGGGAVAGKPRKRDSGRGISWDLAWELAGETTNPTAGFARGIGGHSELATASGGAQIPARPRG